MNGSRSKRIRSLQRELERIDDIGSAADKKALKEKLKIAQTGGPGWRENSAR